MIRRRKNADHHTVLIGLTGRYCAGKNHVASLMEARGIPVLDVDVLGHACLESLKEEVFARFGNDLRREDGGLDRRALGRKVFGDGSALADLEAIVHPEANRRTLLWLAEREGKTCVINAALLHKSSLFGRLDRIVVVCAPLWVRLLRAKRRDRLSWTELFGRFASQKGFPSQYPSGNADIYRVDNPRFGRGKRSQSRLDAEIDRVLADRDVRP
ncbi:MAG: dephospho-CoA kinase [Treponema sp.]|nr:dephospho-CoA kinase [Treponema sp.]